MEDQLCSIPVRGGKLEGIMCGKPAVQEVATVGPVCMAHLGEAVRLALEAGRTYAMREAGVLPAPEPLAHGSSIADSAGRAFMQGAFNSEVGVGGETEDGRAQLSTDPAVSADLGMFHFPELGRPSFFNRKLDLSALIPIIPPVAIFGPILLGELHARLIENRGSRFLVSDDLLLDLVETIEEARNLAEEVMPEASREYGARVPGSGLYDGALREHRGGDDTATAAVLDNRPGPTITPAGELAIQGVRLAACVGTFLEAFKVGTDGAPLDVDADVPAGWITLSGSVPPDLWARLLSLVGACQVDDYASPMSGNRPGSWAEGHQEEDGEPAEADPFRGDLEEEARARLLAKPAAPWAPQPCGELDGED